MATSGVESSHEQVSSTGFALIRELIPREDVERLLQALNVRSLPRRRAGFRHALRHPVIAEFASDARLVSLASEIVDAPAIPYRATLFDKSPASNWLVTWHQDKALPILNRREVPGWGSWSVKDGITYAHAPASALEKVIALRVHLDDSNAENGPLRVLPGTHASGVLEDDAIHLLASTVPPVDCLVPLGGVIAMRPLIVHASSKSRSNEPRRVLHIEYAPSLDLENGLKLARA